MSLFAIYLTCNGIWAEFIDYAILGINTFVNYSSYTYLLKIIDINIRVLAHIFPILLLVSIVTFLVTVAKKNLRDKMWARNLYVLLVYSIASATILFPIADRMHFGIGIMCTFVMSIYLMYILICKLLKRESNKFKEGLKIFFKIVSILVFLASMILSINLIVSFIKDTENVYYLEHFKYIKINDELYNSIINIDKYILEKEQEGKNVIVLDTMAASINIPINRYYKNYDMFNLGNLGSKGEEGIIEDLSKTENTLVMVRKEIYSNNWQMPMKVVKYVRNNYKFVDEIEMFDVLER